MGFGEFVFIVIVLIVLVAIFSKSQKQHEEEARKKGIAIDQKVDTGKYIAGHPEIDNATKATCIIPSNDKIDIYHYEHVFDMGKPFFMASINTSTIENILVEDATEIERKVTVGRLLAVGIFAFAFKAAKKHELAYLTIQWKEGKFNHETYFEFTGKDAMQKANTARNRIIKFVNAHEGGNS